MSLTPEIVPASDEAESEIKYEDLYVEIHSNHGNVVGAPLVFGCDICGDDHETDECPVLQTGKKICDTEAPSRARLTLPKSLRVQDLADGTTTVVAQEPIPKSTQFGPFEGKKTYDFNVATRFQLKIFEKDGSFVYLDTTDEMDCNWMCLVSTAAVQEEMNLIAYQLQQDIYFFAVESIDAGAELRVWYSSNYGKKMGIPAPWETSTQIILPPEPVTLQNSRNEMNFQLQPDQNRMKRKRKKKMARHKIKRSYYCDDESEEEEESEQTRQQVVQTLDPRRLGFKEIRDWKCSQCGDMFQNCLDFARHLSDHYKPRPPGAKRSDAGIKRPKSFACEMCGQRFTTERLCHRHKVRHHQRTLRRLRKCQVVLEDMKLSQNADDGVSYVEVTNIDGVEHVPSTPGEALPKDSQDSSNSNEKEDSFMLPDVVLKESTDLKENQTGEVKLAEVETYLSENGVGSDTVDIFSSPDKAHIAESLEHAIQGMIQDDDSSNIDRDVEGHDENGAAEELAAANELSSDHEHEENDENDENEENEDDENDENQEERDDKDGDQSEASLLYRYECDICHKKFEKSIYLFRHIRKHTGDFTCLQCHKVFARKESMLKHQCPGLINESDKVNYDFTCTFCNKSFGNDRLLKRHLAKHTGEFTCPECGKSYTSRDILANHSCTKNPVVERYACEICHKTFTKLKYLDKHIPVHTGVFSCPICGKWLRSNDSLINHMRICGQVKELEANGTATCPHCKEEFTDLKAFRRHMYDHTHMFACESCGARFRNKLSLGLHVCNAERSISCDECGEEFTSVANLNSHRMTHGEPEFSCNQCGRSYHRKEALLKHPCQKAKRFKRKASKNFPSLMPLICEICGSMFSSTSSLNVHKNLHGEKKFSCLTCSKRFHRKDLLMEHLAVHGQPEIPCPVCSKLFKTKKSLDVHLLIHDGIKRFKCQTCGKMFYQKGNLQKHEETHTPGRKHTCVHCHKSFSSKEYLTIHVLEHTRGRIFSCQICARSFVKEHQLKAHRRIFHGNQAYVCKYCGLSVKLRHSLKRHLEKKHSNVRSDWDSNEQIAAMLMKQSSMQEELIAIQDQETVITEVSPTQGAEVLLAVAGIGSAALQQAIADGTARIQQGSVPNTIEISLPVGSEEFQNAILPDLLDGNSEETRTIIQHVVSDDTNMDQNAEAQHIEISVAQDGDELSQIAVMEGDVEEEQTLTDGRAIVLENGTVLQQGGGEGNPSDLLFYVLTTSDSQELQ